jgi:hypothetical protein
VWEFIDAIKGEEEEIGMDLDGMGDPIPGTGQVSRVPLENPERPGQYAFRATGTSVGGKGVSASAQPEGFPERWENATYSFAEIDVEFRRPEFALSEGSVWGRRSLRISAEAITAPGSPYEFVTGGKPINQDVGLILPLIDVRFTRYWLTAAKLIELENLVEDLIYTTNDAPFTLTGKTYPAGTLLCAGLVSNADFAGIGNIQANAELSFLIKRTGWNFVPTWEGSGGFKEVTPEIYEPADYEPFKDV